MLEPHYEIVDVAHLRREVGMHVDCGAVTVASFFGMQDGSARLHNRADLQERVAEWWALLRPALAPAVVRQFFTPARGVALDNPGAQCVLSCTTRSHYARAGR